VCIIPFFLNVFHPGLAFLLPHFLGSPRLCYLISVAPPTRSTTTCCCQSWRGDRRRRRRSTMVSVLPPGPVADAHGKRNKSKNSPCRLQCGTWQLSRTRGIHSIHGKRRISLRSSIITSTTICSLTSDDKHPTGRRR